MRSSLKSLSMALIAASAIYSSGVMAADKDTKSDNLRPVGEAVDCIYRPSIQHTEVRNDRTIDFHMNGSKIYRNTLPNSCPSLGSERKFSYKTSISQLCSVDIITVLHNMGGGHPPQGRAHEELEDGSTPDTNRNIPTPNGGSSEEHTSELQSLMRN